MSRPYGHFVALNLKAKFARIKSLVQMYITFKITCWQFASIKLCFIF